MTIKILDIGSGEGVGTADDMKTLFGNLDDVEITRLDAQKNVKPDIVHDITKPLAKRYHEAFDIVVASHSMEHVGRRDTLDAFKNIAEAVKIGGELYVIVPSLEWAVAEVYFGRMSTAVQAVIFGGQGNKNDYHKVGYTLDWLRFIIENVLKMPVRKAYQAPFTIKVDEDVHMALQNVVIGLKVETVKPDASDAIE